MKEILVVRQCVSIVQNVILILNMFVSKQHINIVHDADQKWIIHKFLKKMRLNNDRRKEVDNGNRRITIYTW